MSWRLAEIDITARHQSRMWMYYGGNVVPPSTTLAFLIHVCETR